MTDRYSKEKDVTAMRTSDGGGLAMRKMCFTCNKPRPDQGGRKNKRTRMWSCGACLEAIKKETV